MSSFSSSTSLVWNTVSISSHFSVATTRCSSLHTVALLILHSVSSPLPTLGMAMLSGALGLINMELVWVMSQTESRASCGISDRWKPRLVSLLTCTCIYYWLGWYTHNLPLSVGDGGEWHCYLIDRLPTLEAEFLWVWELPYRAARLQHSQEYPTDFAAVVTEWRWIVRSSAAQAAVGEIWLAVPVAMSLPARECPKLTLPLLSYSAVSVVHLSQFSGPHTVLFPFPFSLSLCLIVMGLAQGLLTSEFLSNSSVFFSCRLHPCIVLLNCRMNEPELSVTESSPLYSCFGRTVGL